MKHPENRIIFPLDLPSWDEAASYVEKLTADVGVFKVGLELFIAEGPEILHSIRDITDKEIFLDLKLHDIPATMRRAIRSAARHRPEFITVHCDEGGGFLKECTDESPGAIRLLGVTLLTSLNTEKLLRSGYDPGYAEDLSQLVLLRARIAREAGCHGIVCSGHEAAGIRKHLGPDLIIVTPGIRPAWTLVPGDDQQRIVTPADAIRRGADYVVIGRPIRDAQEPADAAKRVAEEIASAF